MRPSSSSATILCSLCRPHPQPSFPYASTSTHTSTSTRSISSPPKTTSSIWPTKRHLLPSKASIPNPTPSIYPQIVLLSDGSSFTSYTTAPVTSKVIRLTRDLTNNPGWNLALEGRKSGEEEGGRLSAFRRRFGGASSSSSSAVEESTQTKSPTTKSSDIPPPSSFSSNDLDWMSEEAGVQEKVSAKDMNGPQKAKGKKK